MDCLICDAIKSKSVIVYEDERVAVFLLSKGFTIGHLKVVPKNHFSILEQMPDDLLSYTMLVANRFASILFDALGLHGTNILIQNGLDAGQLIPHFAIDIVPRRPNDGLNFKWDMNKASHESLEGTKNIFIEALEGGINPAVEKPVQAETEQISSDSEKENYLLKQLRRIP
jgi:histidine triad (HIT) family protein